jgi:hypothetical protein
MISELHPFSRLYFMTAAAFPDLHMNLERARRSSTFVEEQLEPIYDELVGLCDEVEVPAEPAQCLRLRVAEDGLRAEGVRRSFGGHGLRVAQQTSQSGPLDASSSFLLSRESLSGMGTGHRGRRRLARRDRGQVNKFVDHRPDPAIPEPLAALRLEPVEELDRAADRIAPGGAASASIDTVVHINAFLRRTA